MEVLEILNWTAHAGLQLVHLCGLACTAIGGIGLAVAVFQLAFFVSHAEATLARAAIQLLLIPTGGYLVSAVLPPNATWSALSFSRMLLCVALIAAGSIGLAVGSAEMMTYHMPLELWRRMAFYTGVLGVALIMAPFECKMKFA